MNRRRALAALAALAGAACARHEGDDMLVVFAAASLREVFGRLAASFERETRGVRVACSFAGTQELAAQFEHGAPADVLATADVATAERLARAGRVAAPEPFARNEPVVVVPAVAEAPIERFEDLPRAARLVLGAPEVPIGRYTDELLAKASAAYGPRFGEGVRGRVVSREANVRQVLAKVRLGEADAGIVYRTDARAAGGSVKIVEIPREVNVVATYAITTLKGGPRLERARGFTAHVLSEAGRRALAEAGFLRPEALAKAP